MKVVCIQCQVYICFLCNLLPESLCMGFNQCILSLISGKKQQQAQTAFSLSIQRDPFSLLVYLHPFSTCFSQFSSFPHTTRYHTQLKPDHTSQNSQSPAGPAHPTSQFHSRSLSPKLRSMPSKIQLDENLWFLYICLQKSDMKSVRPLYSLPISHFPSLIPTQPPYLPPPFSAHFSLVQAQNTSGCWLTLSRSTSQL